MKLSRQTGVLEGNGAGILGFTRFFERLERGNILGKGGRRFESQLVEDVFAVKHNLGIEVHGHAVGLTAHLAGVPQSRGDVAQVVLGAIFTNQRVQRQQPALARPLPNQARAGVNHLIRGASPGGQRDVDLGVERFKRQHRGPHRQSRLVAGGHGARVKIHDGKTVAHHVDFGATCRCGQGTCSRGGRCLCVGTTRHESLHNHQQHESLKSSSCTHKILLEL